MQKRMLLVVLCGFGFLQTSFAQENALLETPWLVDLTRSFLTATDPQFSPDEKRQNVRGVLIELATNVRSTAQIENFRQQLGEGGSSPFATALRRVFKERAQHIERDVRSRAGGDFVAGSFETAAAMDVATLGLWRLNPLLWWVPAAGGAARASRRAQERVNSIKPGEVIQGLSNDQIDGIISGFDSTLETVMELQISSLEELGEQVEVSEVAEPYMEIAINGLQALIRRLDADERRDIFVQALGRRAQSVEVSQFLKAFLPYADPLFLKGAQLANQELLVQLAESARPSRKLVKLSEVLSLTEGDLPQQIEDSQVVAIVEKAHEESKVKVINLKGEATNGGSVAQVHRAELKDGTKVRVKVSFPDGKKRLYAEAEVLKDSTTDPSAKKVIDALTEGIDPEFNLRKEHENLVDAARVLKKDLSSDPEIELHVVEPVKGVLPHPRVLVTYEVQGTKLTKFLSENESDRSLVAQGLVKLYGELIREVFFGTGLIVSDPHPGNLLLEKVGPKLVIHLVDGGAYLRMPGEGRNAVVKIAMSAMLGRSEAVIDALRDMKMLKKGEIPASLAKKLDKILSQPGDMSKKISEVMILLGQSPEVEIPVYIPALGRLQMIFTALERVVNQGLPEKQQVNLRSALFTEAAKGAATTLFSTAKTAVGDTCRNLVTGKKNGTPKSATKPSEAPNGSGSPDRS